MVAEPARLPFAKTFRELLVYRRAFEVSIDVHEHSLLFPKIEQYGGLTDQMRRASKGVCLTIAEGYGKSRYSGEWKRFLLMALGSAQEMQASCEYVIRLGYAPSDKALEWDEAYIEIGKMLQGLIQKIGKE